MSECPFRFGRRRDSPPRRDCSRLPSPRRRYRRHSETNSPAEGCLWVSRELHLRRNHAGGDSSFEKEQALPLNPHSVQSICERNHGKAEKFPEMGILEKHHMH